MKDATTFPLMKSGKGTQRNVKKMKNKIDISVIIPAFNAESSIQKIITSLLNEKNLNIELIIVNDGSSDRTKDEILHVNDNRVIYLEQPNKGVYAARNLALKHHSGEWVVFLDADDLVDNDFLSKRYTVARNNDVDVYISNAQRKTPTTTTKIHSKQVYNKKITGHQWINSCVSENEWPHYLWLQIVKSSYIRSNNMAFHPGRSHKDILWTMTLAEKNGVFFISDNCDYTYLINPSSITNRDDYYDFRALDYIDIISTLVSTAYKKENADIRLSLFQHSLTETRHFLGLFRRKVSNKREIKQLFKKEISLSDLAKGIRNLSDLAFFSKLVIKMH
ncbi:TPA: glycosyltransferase [Enterobacter cancerogenus]|uniref:glycosyltransferase n=1 Tax=Enterobacter cancerogenus TaxID=69218 RepID=UPI001F1900C7|nr:glycosyltransferase [Enterobacter cancerogenus]MDT7009106.1 glycosyltransferase [Enterobacter cancerogenus]WNN57880.1 glycosyltransferase [Enterobacter cancerogenus]